MLVRLHIISFDDLLIYFKYDQELYQKSTVNQVFLILYKINFLFLINHKQFLQMRKLAICALAITATGYAYQNITQTYVFTRNLRTIRCGLKILYFYKIAFNEENCMQIHQNIAKDIYQTCKTNDGLYVKMGQGMATMDHLLPPPYYKWLSKLQDKANASPKQKIQKVFKDEVGITVQQAFLKFDYEPVASASLAQVHKATLKNGRQVAVKIQKSYIKSQFKPDMMMHYLINWVLQFSFDLPLLHFVDDIQANLAKQLDFRIEAANAKKSFINFKKLKRNQIHVPEIIDEFTRERVMVSEWIDGIKVTDGQKLKALNFNQKQIMTDIIRAFAQQIFVSGFIHCDPHPGNIFVRPDPKNPKKHQVVILDFGLCIQISDKFRKEYATFWKSMFLQDNNQMKRICSIWGLPYSQHFAGLTLMRPYTSTKLLTKKVEKQDIIKMQLQMKQKMKQLMKQTINFPKQLLFISRNMNLVRSLNKHYGGLADRISIMAKTAYIGSKFDTSHKTERSFKYWINSCIFSTRILILQVINMLVSLTSGKTIDEHIQTQQIKETKKLFQSYGFKPISQNTYQA